ncbi:hypothetical protein HMPREF2527_01545 [Rothia sp. HMSC071B01]|uniref:hypothetical protein n=1 Tax=Rothia sp. HMSC071B01 TaxID=1715007 RepID=UPI0008A2F651|nr:hypothetical protein [Rothia sp. HMSC071B01]OFN70421.1 hypothetical protein HMPREF2527_01545 [Rothia sp. HMSC071B01]
MHPAQKHSTQTSSTTLRTAQRYSPVALGATLLLALSACSGGATTASPSATAIPSPSATSAKATPTRTVTVTESTPTAGTVHTPTAAATVSPGTITTASPAATAQASAASSPSASAKANTSAKASSTASLSSSDVQSAGGSCGSMDATGYLKHNATVQVTSGAVDCLFARELIRQFVVQNPAEVTDKANGERTVMSARCYWKPGDGADRATPECVSLDGGSTVITVKLTN